MAKARALDRRRKSVKNIRKITRTMELIATARFKKAMDRSIASRDYTLRLAKILENIAAASAGGADGEGGGTAAAPTAGPADTLRALCRRIPRSLGKAKKRGKTGDGGGAADGNGAFASRGGGGDEVRIFRTDGRGGDGGKSADDG